MLLEMGYGVETPENHDLRTHQNGVTCMPLTIKKLIANSITRMLLMSTLDDRHKPMCARDQSRKYSKITITMMWKVLLFRTLVQTQTHTHISRHKSEKERLWNGKKFAIDEKITEKIANREKHNNQKRSEVHLIWNYSTTTT
jgi:hypothetical protein